MPDLNFIKKLRLTGREIDSNTGVSDEYHTISRTRAIQIDPPLSNPAVLIIDDESDICYLLSTILKQKDLPAVFAISLSEANALIEQNEGLSFIFLDNYLPDGLGIDNIKQIKKKCPLCKLIMITAHDTQSDREKAKFAGADHFLGKPFSREMIFKAIERLSA
ncbi:MAG: response regulator [Chitinophagales bacterium]